MQDDDEQVDQYRLPDGLTTGSGRLSAFVRVTLFRIPGTLLPMNAPESNADRPLIDRLRRGDLHALEGLFTRHSRAVYGFFYRTTGSRAVAEDLAQDVFLRILRYRASFRSGRPFRVWMYGIARNVLADHRSRATPETAFDELVDEPVSAGPLAQERLERNESRELVRRALARLGEADRDLLTLSRFQDLKHAELAELFGCTKGAVKVRLHRAVKRLAAEIETLRAEVNR